MAISARSRRGTSPSFWRTHNATQMMMAQACMPSVHSARTLPILKVDRAQPVAPVWFPTPIQRAKYQSRSAATASLVIAR